MASDLNGPEPPKRDIKNHMLFEVATEVANRGQPISGSVIHPLYIANLTLFYDSWRNLFRSQVQSSRHYSRVWREIYLDLASKSRLGISD